MTKTPQAPLLLRTGVLLGLDLGTDCGYAFADYVPGTPITWGPHQSGLLRLDARRFEGGGVRYVRFRNFLNEMNPVLIGFEEIQFRQSSVGAAAVYHGLMAVMSGWCESHDPVVPYCGITPGEIKCQATGKGNASKLQMIEAANAKLGASLKPTPDKDGQDDIADAMWALQVLLAHYAGGLENQKGI